jgi:hypothetical protein
MAGTPARHAPSGVAFRGWFGEGRGWLVALLPIFLLAVAFLARAVLAPVATVPGRIAGAVSNLPAPELLARGADKLEAATAADGTGYRFEVVARSIAYARPDGPRIEVPDPADPAAPPALVDEVDVGGSMASGYVTPDGYVLQMRRGPETRQQPPDFDGAEPTLAALLRDGKPFRNDGAGWYETDLLPGLGLDPATIAGLPTLLRHGTDIKAEEPLEVKGTTMAAVSAKGTVADAPSLMGAGAEEFTVFDGPLTYAFDDQGRLAQLRVRMVNTNSRTFELVVETTIDFRYDDVPDDLPRPEPLAPTVDGQPVAPKG